MNTRRARIVRIAIMASAVLWMVGLAIGGYLARAKVPLPAEVGETPEFAIEYLDLERSRAEANLDGYVDPLLVPPFLLATAAANGTPTVCGSGLWRLSLESILRAQEVVALSHREVVVALNDEFDRPSMEGVGIEDASRIESAREAALLTCRLSPGLYQECVWDTSIASWRVGMALFARAVELSDEEPAWMDLASRSISATRFTLLTLMGPDDGLDSMTRDMHEPGWRYATAYMTSHRVLRDLPDPQRYQCADVSRLVPVTEELFESMQSDVFHPPELLDAVRNLSTWIAGAAATCAGEGELAQAEELLDRADGLCRVVATAEIPAFDRYYEFGLLGRVDQLEWCVYSSGTSWSHLALNSVGFFVSPNKISERFEWIQRARGTTHAYADLELPGVDEAQTDWGNTRELRRVADEADKALTRYYSVLALMVLGLHLLVLLILGVLRRRR